MASSLTITRELLLRNIRVRMISHFGHFLNWAWCSRHSCTLIYFIRKSSSSVAIKHLFGVRQMHFPARHSIVSLPVLLGRGVLVSHGAWNSKILGSFPKLWHHPFVAFSHYVSLFAVVLFKFDTQNRERFRNPLIVKSLFFLSLQNWRLVTYDSRLFP